MAEVVNVLLPIFAVVALGTVLRQSGFASPQLFRETNRLVYYVALPAFLFLKSAESQLQGDAAVRVFSVLFGGLLAAVALGYLLARLMRLPGPTTAAFVQGGYRSNLAYVGLPIVLLAVASQGGANAPALQALGVISIALLTPIYNVVAVLVLLAARPGSREQLGQRMRELGYRLVTNPLILSCAAGLLVMALGWKLPPPLRQALATIGDMTTPLALLGIGAALTFATLRSHARNATVASLVKVVAAPLAGLALATWLGLSQPELRMSLIFLACPTAAASYVMAQQMGADDGLAANIIVLSTVLSLPALAVIVAGT
jgi:malate permease and related proteins